MLPSAGREPNVTSRNKPRRHAGRRRRSGACCAARPRGARARLRTPAIEPLERRYVLSAAFDLIGLTAMRADADFADIDGTNVSVAVIDTGVDVTHPLIAPNFIAGADLVYGGADPTPVVDHGTHVAGIVGATDPEIGVAPDVGLIGLQVFTRQPGGNPSAFHQDTEQGLQWVLDNRQQYNIVAVNMSLGGGFYTQREQADSDIYADEIQRLEAAGVTVVSAAGNAYGISPDPATGQLVDRMYVHSGSPGILSTLNVGAVWETNEGSRVFGSTIDLTTAADRLTSFSQRPPTAEGNVIFAPGAMINSTIPGNRFAEYPGTSMASPMVAGVVALMQEAAMKFGGRRLSPDEVREIILATAETIFDGDDEDATAFIDANGDGRPSPDEYTAFNPTNQNYSRINVHQAMQEIQRRFEEIGPRPPGGGAGSGDPNGTIAGAFLGPTLDGSPVTPITGSIGNDGGTLEGGAITGGVEVGDTDVDMVRFEVLSPGNVTLETSTLSAAPLDFDTLLRLFDPDGNQLASDDDGGAGQFSRIQVSLDPGAYFVGLSGFNNAAYDPQTAGSGVAGATGNYALELTLGNSDPNGLISGAVPVNPGGYEPEVFSGSIGSDYGQAVGVADVDLYRVVVPDDGVGVVDVDTPFASGYVDSYLRVFDGDGNPLIASDDDLSVDNDGFATEWTDLSYPGLVFEDPFDRTFFHGHTTDSFIIGDVARGQVYYIGVSDYFNQSYDPRNLNDRPAAGSGGDYELEISFFNNDLNGSIPQAVDATLVGLPVVAQPGIIGADGLLGGGLQPVGDRDVDFVRLRPAEDGILEIDVDSYSEAAIADPVDTVLYLFDTSGELLGGNDDSDGPDPLLRVDVSAGQDCFAAIVGLGNDNFDPFQLGSGSPGDVGEYLFTARLLPAGDVATLSNDRLGYAGVTELAPGDSLREFVGSDWGYVRGAADVDLFRFVAGRAGRVEINTELVSDFSADTFLRVFDAGGSELAANDNAAAGRINSRLVLDVLAAETYYIGVNGAGPDAGDYDPVTGVGAAAGSEGDYALSIDYVSPDTVGLYDPAGGVFHLKNSNSRSGGADVAFRFGPRGSVGWPPLVGDWNGDGTDTVGLYDPFGGVFHLKNSNANPPGGADVAFRFGPRGGAGWQPIVGDFDGDGVDTVGLYDPTGAGFHLKNSNRQGPADVTPFRFGPRGDLGWTAMVGDFNGDGVDAVGLYDPVGGGFHLKNSNQQGPADVEPFRFGPRGAAGWQPLCGDFDGDGVDSVGLYFPAGGGFYLKNINANPPSGADLAFRFGPTGDLGWTALVGDWDGPAKSSAAAAAVGFQAASRTAADMRSLAEAFSAWAGPHDPADDTWQPAGLPGPAEVDAYFTELQYYSGL